MNLKSQHASREALLEKRFQVLQIYHKANIQKAVFIAADQILPVLILNDNGFLLVFSFHNLLFQKFFRLQIDLIALLRHIAVVVFKNPHIETGDIRKIIFDLVQIILQPDPGLLVVGRALVKPQADIAAVLKKKQFNVVDDALHAGIILIDQDLHVILAGVDDLLLSLPRDGIAGSKGQPHRRDAHHQK